MVRVSYKCLYSAPAKLLALLLVCLASTVFIITTTANCSSSTSFQPTEARPAAASSSSDADRPLCRDVPVGGQATCLEQAMWGKCSEPFMRTRCDLSCGRCVSSERSQLQSRVLLVSARQHSPCAAPTGDFWAMRSQENKAAYAQTHGMTVTWTSALIDEDYDGAWNKLVYLRQLMRHALNQSSAAGARRALWLLWADWDLIFTHLGFELPLEEYEARGVRLVMGGEEKGVYDEADYLKLNTGLMLLRVSSWALALLERMLNIGRKPARHKHALAAQRVVRNLCANCLDDQAVLLQLLHDEPQRWRRQTLFERRFTIQGYWEDYVGALPPSAAAGGGGAPPASLLREVFGRRQLPFSIHYAGCQLCSAKADAAKARRCWPAYREAVRFAEDQALRPLGLMHAPANRSASDDAPLRSLPGSPGG